MSFVFEENDDFVDVDLDRFLHNNENRKPNKLGLYRMSMLCVANSGYGKTTTILKALLSGFIEDFGLIVIIIPRESAESGYYKSLIDATRKNKISGFLFYIIGEDDLPSIETLNKISNEIKSPMALIIDDYVNAFSRNEWLLFKRYITQLSRVSYGASLFALCQDLYTLRPAYRKGFNSFCIFPASFTQMSFNDVLRNYYQGQTFNNEELKTMYTTFKQDKHGALWLINNGQEKSMMFNNIWIKKL